MQDVSPKNMPKTRFEGRYGLQTENEYLHYVFDDPSPANLEDLFLECSPPGEPWGDAMLRHSEAGVARVMAVLSHPDLGYYFHYQIGCPDSGALSCGDRLRLSEVVCPDDLEVSAGLFVSPESGFAVA